LFVLESLMEIFAFEELRYGVLRHQAYEVIRSELAHPPPVEVDHCFLRVQNFENLRLVSFGILLDLFARKRRPGHGAAGGVADHAREVADQKDGCVAKVLKVLQLPQDHGMSKVQIG